MKSAASRDLKDLKILVVDCQATSSRPETGFLLELGWSTARASETCETDGIVSNTQTFLLPPPRNTAVPPQVLRITGIQPEDLESAHSRQAVWVRLEQEAHSIANDAGLWPCPTVIHYARYEVPFLSLLHAEFGNDTPFPLNIVCTHQIVQRLFPGLPRKGLRPVTGFFGYSLPELRRCRQHVLATALIWRHLVETLANEQNITSLSELQTWLEQPFPLVPGQRQRRVFPMDQKLRQGLPEGPGLYRMYRLNGDILYVGKAKSLKHRVNSYFRPQSRHSEHILEMLSQAKDLTYTPTQSALEAAVKESDEIKRLRPLFNRALKDNGRELCYFSSDLKMFRPTWQQLRFPLGPFTSPRHGLPLGSLIDLLNLDLRRVSGRCIQNLLDLPLEYLPDRGVFKQGVRALQQEYPLLASRSVDIAALKHIGARLWRDRLREAPREDNGLEQDLETEEDDRSEPGIWTRERVARLLKSLIRNSTHQLRRARWLLRLSEAKLIWMAGHDTQKKYGAEVHKARVTFPDPLAPRFENFGRTDGEPELEARHAYFDLAAYDRMRILTTEIRRLVQEGREVELHLVPHTRLSTARLRRLLPWV